MGPRLGSDGWKEVSLGFVGGVERGIGLYCRVGYRVGSGWSEEEEKWQEGEMVRLSRGPKEGEDLMSNRGWWD